MNIIKKMQDAGLPDWGIIAFMVGAGFVLAFVGHGFFG